jgi:hypothetical protein
MPATAAHSRIAVVGIDIGKNSFHVVGLDRRGAIVLWPPRAPISSTCRLCTVCARECERKHRRPRPERPFGDRGLRWPSGGRRH